MPEAVAPHKYNDRIALYRFSHEVEAIFLRWDTQAPVRKSVRVVRKVFDAADALCHNLSRRTPQ